MNRRNTSLGVGVRLISSRTAATSILRSRRSHSVVGPLLPVFVSVLVLCALSAAIRADDDENDTVPGLVGTYRADRTSIRRIDPEVAFDLKTDAPDPRLARGPFSVRWSGQLLVREAIPLRFHAFVQGNVAVTVDGRSALTGRREAAGWISGDAIELGLGEKPISITFESSAKGATLKLFWSSARFPLEPLPAYLLFCDSSAIPERKELAQIEKGRRAFEVARCNRCHHRPELFSLAAPSLVQVADGLSRSAIIEKLARHTPRPAGEHMPTFDLTRDEAAAITAFLLQEATPAGLEEAPKFPTSPRRRARGRRTYARSAALLATRSRAEKRVRCWEMPLVTEGAIFRQSVPSGRSTGCGPGSPSRTQSMPTTACRSSISRKKNGGRS